MRRTVGLLLIVVGTIVCLTAMYIYWEVSRSSEPVAKRSGMPTPTVTSEATATPTKTPEVVPTPTPMPTHTQSAAAGGPVLPQIPFPGPVAQRTLNLMSGRRP